ncbi:MAG: DUF2807 domain-containing protein [Winogradskyella sp.]|nr:DUF2807 domain-containing protein [Winogradskyella sp.]
MNTLVKIIVTGLISLLLVSCNFNDNFFGMGVKGNGNVVTLDRNVDAEFDKIEVSRGLDLYITQSSEPALTVEADENLHDIIVTEIIDGTLRIYTEDNISMSSSQKIFVNVISLSSLEATSGSDVFSTNTIESETLHLKGTSGSDIELSVNTKTITCKSTSGSDVKLSGKTDTVSGESTSGSDINAKELISNRATVRATSGADISIYASQKIEAKASSGGDIAYYGKPAIVNAKDGSSGSIRGH